MKWNIPILFVKDFFRKIPKYVLISGGLFIFFFLVAFTSFLFVTHDREKHLVFFFEYQQGTLGGEVRSIPWRPSVEDRVLLLVEELLWGPMDPRLSRVFPLGSQVRSILVREGILYVDLSPDVLFTSEDVRIEWNDRLKALHKTLSHNYPRFKKIYITVNGQIPGVPSFVPQNDEKQKKIR
jgi:hypothetical protein